MSVVRDETDQRPAAADLSGCCRRPRGRSERPVRQQPQELRRDAAGVGRVSREDLGRGEDSDACRNSGAEPETNRTFPNQQSQVQNQAWIGNFRRLDVHRCKQQLHKFKKLWI